MNIPFFNRTTQENLRNLKRKTVNELRIWCLKIKKKSCNDLVSITFNVDNKFYIRTACILKWICNKK